MLVAPILGKQDQLRSLVPSISVSETLAEDCSAMQSALPTCGVALDLLCGAGERADNVQGDIKVESDASNECETEEKLVGASSQGECCSGFRIPLCMFLVFI